MIYILKSCNCFQIKIIIIKFNVLKIIFEHVNKCHSYVCVIY